MVRFLVPPPLQARSRGSRDKRNEGCHRSLFPPWHHRCKRKLGQMLSLTVGRIMMMKQRRGFRVTAPLDGKCVDLYRTISHWYMQPLSGSCWFKSSHHHQISSVSVAVKHTRLSSAEIIGSNPIQRTILISSSSSKCCYLSKHLLLPTLQTLEKGGVKALVSLGNLDR